MSREDELKKIINKHGNHISRYKEYVPVEDINNIKLRGIQSKIEYLQKGEIIGFIDKTITQNGREGLLFTTSRMILRDKLSASNVKIDIRYSDLKDAKIQYAKRKDYDSTIIIYTRDGEEFVVDSNFLNKIPLILCIQEIANLWEGNIKENKSDSSENQIKTKDTTNKEPLVLECPNCGKLFSKENKFCSECGTKLELRTVSPVEIIINRIKNDECLFCGTKNDKNAKVCKKCETKLIHVGDDVNELLDLYSDTKANVSYFEVMIKAGESLESLEEQVGKDYKGQEKFAKELEQYIVAYTMMSNGWATGDLNHPVWLREDFLDNDEDDDL